MQTEPAPLIGQLWRELFPPKSLNSATCNSPHCSFSFLFGSGESSWLGKPVESTPTGPGFDSVQAPLPSASSSQKTEEHKNSAGWQAGRQSGNQCSRSKSNSAFAQFVANHTPNRAARLSAPPILQETTTTPACPHCFVKAPKKMLQLYRHLLFCCHSTTLDQSGAEVCACTTVK